MMKMTINLLGVMMAGVAETVNFGLKNDLDQEAILDVIFSSPLNCGLIQMKADMLRTRTFPPNFPLKHVTKDLKFIIDTAYDSGAPAPADHAIPQLFRAGVGFQLGDEDLAAVFEVLEHMNSRI